MGRAGGAGEMAAEVGGGIGAGGGTAEVWLAVLEPPMGPVGAGASEMAAEVGGGSLAGGGSVEAACWVGAMDGDDDAHTALAAAFSSKTACSFPSTREWYGRTSDLAHTVQHRSRR